jgi:hypothetical protein
MKPSDLERLLHEGESEQVEFKRALPPDPILARVLSAFANTRGGTLLVGVDETGGRQGFTDGEASAALDRLERLSARLFPFPVSTGKVRIDGGGIIVFVEVPPAPSHLYPIATARGEVVIRKGASTVFVDAGAGTKSPASAHGPACVLFVAMSFREEDEPHLVDYFDAINRAVEATGLPIRVTRIDLEPGDKEISQAIMDAVKAAGIFLADFTMSPRNVYFELGFARGTNKIIIQTARYGTELEFDVKTWRTLFYKNATELRTKLDAEIREAYKRYSEQTAAA